MQALRDQGVVDVARERWANPDDGSLWQRVRWFAGGALILLTAMYVSGTYGGAITAILFRIPGEPMDVPLIWAGSRQAAP